PQAADRHPGELAVVEDRLVHARMADAVARDADAATPRGRGDGRPPGATVDGATRPVALAFALDGAHLSTPVTTTPRMNARWANRKMMIGTAIVSSADAWMSVGW